MWVGGKRAIVNFIPVLGLDLDRESLLPNLSKLSDSFVLSIFHFVNVRSRNTVTQIVTQLNSQ
jgi:hypothetical protein